MGTNVSTNYITCPADGNKTLGVEDMIDRFGVNKGSYEEVMLPKLRAYQANVTGPNAIEMGSEAIPASLEWGEVFVNVRVTPINPADIDAKNLLARSKFPFVAGRFSHRRESR